MSGDQNKKFPRDMCFHIIKEKVCYMQQQLQKNSLHGNLGKH